MGTGDIELVVFDVAGTTIRDEGQVAEAFGQTLRGQGVALTADDLRPWRGASKRRALAHFLERRGAVAPERLEEVYADFRHRLTTEFREQGVQPIAGAGETFAWLRSRGVRVALTTGFDRDVAALLLDAVGWGADRHAIDAIVCGDDVPQGRPAPYMIFRAMERTGVVSVRTVVNVGDTALDLESGANAGLLGNVGVLSGAHSRVYLEQAPHTHLLPSVAELPALLRVEGTHVRFS